VTTRIRIRTGRRNACDLIQESLQIMQYPASTEPGPIQSSDPPSEATLGYHSDPDPDGAPERVRFNTRILRNNAISGFNWARAHSQLRSALRNHSDSDPDGAPERVRFNTRILRNNTISRLNWARAHSELRSALRGDPRIPLGSGSGWGAGTRAI